jgi:hypothetical protein
MGVIIMAFEDTWSYLVDYPVTLYFSKYDQYVCFWRGIPMSRSMALAISANKMFNLRPSPVITMRACEEFKSLVDNSIIDTKKISSAVIPMLLEDVKDPNIRDLLIYLVSKSISDDDNFFTSLKESFTHEECVNWFSEEKVFRIE